MSDASAKAYPDGLKVPDNATTDAKRKARNRLKAAAKKPTKARTRAKQLSQATLVDLARSGLNANDAAKMGIEDMTAAQCEVEFGIPRAAYRLPYADFDGVFSDYGRARFTDFIPARVDHEGNKITHDQIKYIQKARSSVHLYLPTLTKWRAVIDDTTIPVYSTEGEKKAAAACKAGVITVGLGGVDAFASSKRDIDLLQELVVLAKGRRMRIAYDSDIISKDEVRLARKKLALQYFLAGGYPEFIDLPPGEDDAKVGLDDYLMAHSKKDFAALPRQEVTPQLLVRWLHNKKKREKLGFDPETTARLIGQVVTEAMRRSGQFIMTDTVKPELLYFDRASAKIFELDEGRGRKLRSFVQNTYSVNGADPQWHQVHEQAANHCAAHGLRVTVHKLSYYDRKTHALYVARSEGELFQITARGRKIVPNGTDHVFVRTDGRLKDVKPAATGSKQAFERVSRVANFKNDDVMSGTSASLLWEAWQLCVFFPQLMPTRPLVVFTGEPGSRKTSAGRAFGRSLMGATFEVSAIDKDKLDGLDAAIVGSPFVVIDNVDGTVPGIENRLAVASTGGHLPRRKLYITMQDVHLPYDAFLAITSHNPLSLTRADVVDRELLLPCIRSDGFKPESQVKAEIDDNRPEWWAHVLELLRKIVAALARPRRQPLEEMRLADFACFVQVAGLVLGYTATQVRQAMQAMVAAKCEFVATMSSIPDALATVVDSRVTELYLESIASGIDGGGFKKRIAECEKPMLAAALLAETRHRVDTFGMKNPKAFGTMLKAQLGAIHTRINCVVQENKHAKQNEYLLTPKGGWLRAVKERIDAEKKRIAAERGATK